MLSGINATKLALIPKIQHLDAISQFRPIAYCNVIYKCIANFLALRLTLALTSTISANQNAFLLGKDIIDNILQPTELLRGYTRQHIPPRCVMKLGIQKAYDTVEWKAIIFIIHCMNFPYTFLA